MLKAFGFAWGDNAYQTGNDGVKTQPRTDMYTPLRSIFAVLYGKSPTKKNSLEIAQFDEVFTQKLMSI